MFGLGLVLNILRSVAQIAATAWAAVEVVAAPVAGVLASGAVGTAITVAAVGAAAVTAGYGTYYMATGQPVAFTPVLPSVPVIGRAVKATPPRYVFAFGGMTGPLGVALSPDGKRVYVTEGAGDRMVRVFDANGKALDPLPAPPGAENHLRLPTAVAVARDGKVYVTDRIMGAVHMYSPDGKYLGPFTPQGNTTLMPEPLAISLGAKDDLYVTDVSSGMHRVMSFDPSSKLRVAFGQEGTAAGQFSYPNGVAADSKGRIYVADSDNGRVAIFNSDGSAAGSVSGEMSLPRGLALDSVGRLYIADAINDWIAVADTTQTPPKPLFTFGETGSNDGQFNAPNAIAVDSATGRVYIADRANNRVSVWAY